MQMLFNILLMGLGGTTLGIEIAMWWLYNRTYVTEDSPRSLTLSNHLSHAATTAYTIASMLIVSMHVKEIGVWSMFILAAFIANTLSSISASKTMQLRRQQIDTLENRINHLKNRVDIILREAE